jgi:hypothetical protein
MSGVVAAEEEIKPEESPSFGKSASVRADLFREIQAITEGRVGVMPSPSRFARTQI